MENNVLKIIMQNNPDLNLDQISKMYTIDKDRIIDYQLKVIASCRFSRLARERDYNQAIKDKLN